MDAKVLDTLVKLAKLANNNPNENEANSAARKVCKLLHEDDYKIIGHVPTPSARNPIPNRPQRSPFEDLWNEMDRQRRYGGYGYANWGEYDEQYTKERQRQSETYQKKQQEEAERLKKEKEEKRQRDKAEKERKAHENREKSKNGVHAYNTDTKNWEYIPKEELRFHPESNSFSDKFSNHYKLTYEGYFKKVMNPQQEEERFKRYSFDSETSFNEHFKGQSYEWTMYEEESNLRGHRQDYSRKCKKCGLEVKTFRVVTSEDFVCAICQDKEERGL